MILVDKELNFTQRKLILQKAQHLSLVSTKVALLFIFELYFIERR